MISLILAMDPNGLIGKNNDLPWNYPEDLKYFKRITLNKTVLMGRITFKSILNRLKKPLPNRKNIVITKSDFNYQDVKIINDLDAFLKKERDEEIIVIGGKSIYEQSFKYADKLYITHIKKEYKGDTYIKIDLSKFKQTIVEENDNLIFAVYERK
ncbi:MAG: dihydrofolate reductase [Candidatus Izimaplasma sp.]|nr:dihydrofolate reductase [Candidatus Izimaplasma bacterium]